MSIIPKVSAALTQFITPISTSRKKPFVSARQKSGGFERQKGQDFEKHSSAQHQNSIAATEEQKTEEVIAQPIASPIASQHQILSVAHSFLQLLGVFRKQQGTLLRWLGAKAYYTSISYQKSSSKFRKGAMLDEKVE